MAPSLDRAHWNRIFSVALFVEHVFLGTESQMPELCELVTEYVFLLDKVSVQDEGQQAQPDSHIRAAACALSTSTVLFRSAQERGFITLAIHFPCSVVQLRTLSRVPSGHSIS